MPPRPNWSRALPRPLSILDKGKEFLRLTTLADVHDFLKPIPKERQQQDTLQAVARRLDDAAAGRDVSIALQMTFQLERIDYRQLIVRDADIQRKSTEDHSSGNQGGEAGCMTQSFIS